MSHTPCFVTREQLFVCDSRIRACVKGSLGQSQDRRKLVVVSCFQEFFASINKFFILAGRLDTRLSFYEVLRFC